jgi:heterotetrameric sarcosine oxidase beta subunit
MITQIRRFFRDDKAAVAMETVLITAPRVDPQVLAGLTGNRGWRRAWRDPAPKAEYDIVIIGGGGHGLATAYYLAKEHGLTNVAVLEKGYLGGGNVGRNTTIVRANYGLPGNSEFYSHSLKLWEGLEAGAELQRDAFAARHHQPVPLRRPARRLRPARQRDDQPGRRRDPADRDKRAQDPALSRLRQTRFPIYGGLYHKRGGTARHDAVAWGYARGADQRGVDLIQNCEVTGIDIEGARDRRADHARGDPGQEGRHRRRRPLGQVAAMAGMRLPIESHILQAFVTEGLKP